MSSNTCWTRICRHCNNTIQYKSEKSYLVAEWNESSCRPCSKKTVPAHSRICPNCQKEILYRSKIARNEAIKNSRWCHQCRNSGTSNPFYGKTHTEEHKLTLREDTAKANGAFFNKTACEYFDNLNKTNKWNGQHAMNGGEALVEGYFLDYYDREKNIVVEYDEHHHEKPSVKKKDTERQNRIIKKLGCRFYRYSEKHNNLYEVFIHE